LFETGQDVGPAPRLGSDVFVAGVPHLGRQVGLIADRFFAAPSERLTVAGITGTNRKTTSAFLLAQAPEHVGRRAVYNGTLGHGFPGELSSSDYTTSDAVTVHRQLAASEDEGADSVAMEVSSHALDQHRVNGVRFHTAAFTNLTRDHL